MPVHQLQNEVGYSIEEEEKKGRKEVIEKINSQKLCNQVKGRDC